MTKPPISVPTESRPTYPRPAKPAAVFYTRFRDAHQIKPGEALSFPQWMEFAEAYAASSSLLPVPITDLIDRYESEISRGLWTVSEPGMRHILHDLKLRAGLPVGRQTKKDPKEPRNG